MRKLGVLYILSITGCLCCAQGLEKIDTILTPDVYNHLFLRINNPRGELKVASSTICGKSVSQLRSETDELVPKIESKEGPSGNLYRNVSFVQQGKPRERFTARIALPRNTFQSPPTSNYTAAYLGDPDIPTNMLVNLGSGTTELDLSGMSISNLKIQSALSDLVLTYTSPNQTEMRQMQIHLASADIQLDQIEKAKAREIHIRNDMGNTSLSMGASELPCSQIRLITGAGTCQLRIAKAHPVKIILRNGMFSHVEIADGFEKVSHKVFVNRAFGRKEKKATTIICETDIGTIRIQEQ